MNARTPLWPARPTLLAGSLLLALASCMNTAAPPGAVAPPAPESDLPADALVALVHGDVSSPVFDALKDRLTLVPYDGSQKAADHDVLVFDGDAHDPAEHAKHPLVDEALRAGTWVLGVDLDEAHKRGSLGSRLGASTKGASHSYLVRTEADAQGRPTVWIIEAPVQPTPATAGDEDPRSTGKNSRTGPAQPSAFLANAGEFADTIVERLSGGVPPSRDLTPQQRNNVPPGLIAKTITYVPQVPDANLGDATKNPGTEQTATIGLVYTFHVYLDNADNPNGNFQYVAVETDVLTNPTGGTGTFACWGCSRGADAAYADEYAHFLGRQTLTVGPVRRDAPLLTMVGTSPATASGVTSYTTDLGFSVGFGGTGAQGSFDYRNTVTRNLTDWKLTNNSTDTTAAWNFRSATPWNFDFSLASGANPGWYASGYPKEPNDLSKTQLELHTQAAWKTAAVLDQKVSFQLAGYQLVADVYCDEGGGGCSRSVQEFATEIFPLSQVLELDLGAVRPNQLESLTFSPNPVAAGNPTTGTVTLTSPAAADTTVNLGPDDANWLVPDTVTVAKGARTGTFPVQTNANDLVPGSSVSGPVTASSALTGEATGQLTITN